MVNKVEEEITLTQRQEEKFKELLKHPTYAFLRTHFTDKFFDIAYISEETGETFKLKRQYQNDPEAILNYVLRYLSKSLIVVKIGIIKFHNENFPNTLNTTEEVDEHLQTVDDIKQLEETLRQMLTERKQQIIKETNG